MAGTTELVMWEANVRAHAFLGQLRACAAGGFTHLALTPAALLSAVEELGGYAAVRTAAADHGVRLDYLDTVTGWAPLRVPRVADEALRARFDFSMDECFELVDQFEMTSILAVGVFDGGAVVFDQLVECFGELARQAQSCGAHVDLEFMPFWGIPDIHTARAIVEAAGCDNTGIMVDTWHFARGLPDFNALTEVAESLSVSIQVADGSARSLDPDPTYETTHLRDIPAEGQLDVVGILAAILSKQTPKSIGPEVFSDSLDRLEPEVAGARLAEAIRKVTAEALGS
ncbi:sugar phosphate isomerase/epimerase family protein [Mycolicibacterium wolinskyi]|uniref:sugar phosphate isomerase/epimerase family protein n=1 Tax=Mycolicibacterium wolinskyi TaxID=59750 RepID=UPI0009FF8948|nr:TIM barrel protein [Mycolicibacterium wolinskyi]